MKAVDIRTMVAIEKATKPGGPIEVNDLVRDPSDGDLGIVLKVDRDEGDERDYFTVYWTQILQICRDECGPDCFGELGWEIIQKG